MKPSISVIIPFHNASRTIERCLEALGNQVFDFCEAILVDNNSSDSSPDLVLSYIASHPHQPVLLVSEKKPGPSAARNRGARDARGEWLAFTDADCVPEPTWLSDYASAIEAYQEFAAFAGMIVPYREHQPVARFAGMFTLFANRKEREYRKLTMTEGGFASANLMVLRELFEKIGGFNESIANGEDWELCCRIYESGGTLRALMSARVEHIHRSDLNGLLRQAFGIGRSHAYCLRYLVPGALIINGPAPFIAINRSTPGLRFWLELHPIDKKLLLLLLAGLCWAPAFAALPLFILQSAYKMHKRAKRFGYDIGVPESFQYVGLLILRSGALGWGRAVGSLQQRVFCI